MDSYQPIYTVQIKCGPSAKGHSHIDWVVGLSHLAPIPPPVSNAERGLALRGLRATFRLWDMHTHMPRWVKK